MSQYKVIIKEEAQADLKKLLQYEPKAYTKPAHHSPVKSTATTSTNLRNKIKRMCHNKHILLIPVGADGFEPPKSKDSRFTVCPIWPLWKTPLF